MARDRRWIDVAVEAVMELSCSIDSALADGQVDEREAETIRLLCREALLLVERADVAERIAASFLRTNGVNPYLRRRAEEVGLRVADLEAA
jgi:hypothetical protein